MDTLLAAIPVGLGATLFVDAWALARRAWLGTPLPDYGLVGRWFAYLPRGRWRHAPIAATPAVRGERLLGWVAHYAIGIAFAALLLAVRGTDWLRGPTLAPALLVGIATVAAPWLVMQPAMGAGIAARRAPRPNATRAQNLVTHAVFGVGLYAAAVAWRALAAP
jgi:hypothetical protein